ncbi:MAG: hypothetical protein KAW00_01455 [Dehalococcoidia bacterium]|nr:hypothetical protein [Dehalococcoidia bacterium]
MNKIKWYQKPIYALVALALVAGWVMIPAMLVSAADLTNVTATPEDAAAGATTNYTINFTTATAGNITYVDMEFATGFNVSGADNISSVNITLTACIVSGQVVNSTADGSPISSGISISIKLGPIVNHETAGNYTVNVTTKWANGTIIDGPTTSAEFAVDASLTVNVTPAGKGNVTADGVLLTNYPNTTTWLNGTVVTINATPNAYWYFVNWTGETDNITDVNATNTTITMTGNYSITANFAQVNYTLTMAVTGNGTTVPAVGGHSYVNGTVVNITATPDAYWDFVNWTGDVADPNSASTNVTVDANKTVTANFAKVPTGGEAYPIDKLAILAPWIALGMAIMAGASVLMLRRRRT